MWHMYNCELKNCDVATKSWIFSIAKRKASQSSAGGTHNSQTIFKLKIQNPTFKNSQKNTRVVFSIYSMVNTEHT